MSKKKKKHIDYQEWVSQELQDPKLALAYLNESLTDDDPTVFFIALKDVLEAQGGDISALAQEANLNRQNLYRILSKKGNPRWDSVTNLFDALGYQIKLLPKK